MPGGASARRGIPHRRASRRRPHIANVFADRAFRFGRADRIAAAAHQHAGAGVRTRRERGGITTASCLRALGDDDEALAALREGYRRDSTFVDTGLVLAELAAERGRRRVARVLERVLHAGGLDDEQADARRCSRGRCVKVTALER